MRSGFISIIIANLNRKDFLSECLASVQAQDRRNWELIVVDNGSTDGSREFLEAYPHPIKTVYFERNTGFTGANIAGLKEAEGDYIVLLNNDVVLSPDWLSLHALALDSNPAAGSTASKTLRYDDPSIVDSAGDGVTTSGRGFKLGEGHEPTPMDSERWVFAASASAVMYRRAMLEETGFLDPRFFFNCEDTDLSMRAQLLGWKCLYIPEATARHRVHGSYGVLHGRAIFYWSRNSELVWLKNMPSSLFWRYFHHHVIHEVGAFVKNLHHIGQSVQVALGKLAVIPLLPHALKERRRIQGSRRISDRQFESGLAPFGREFLRRHAPRAPENGAPIRPSRIRLEVSSHCQLKCPSCPTTVKAIHPAVGSGFLKPADFRGLLDANPGLYGIELSNYGEIFLNPGLIEILQIAHERGVRLSAGNGVNLNTVSEALLEAVVKYRVTNMTCSIDGASNETYARYRVNGRFDTVISNIRAINRYKSSYGSDEPKLRWQFIVFGHNEHELPAARELAAELGMEFKVKLNWDPNFSPVRDLGMVRRETGYASRQEVTEKSGEDYVSSLCTHLWAQPQINWDGKVLGCARNFWGDFAAGNVFRDGLLKSLNSEKMTYARGMLTGQNEARPDIPCTTCDIYLQRKKTAHWVTVA